MISYSTKLAKIFLVTVIIIASVLMTTGEKTLAYGPIIVLDPGHGGADPGAASGSYAEKNLNLNLAKKIKTYLGSFSSNVYLTRSTDTYLSLAERATFANNLGADMFLSIHHDSSTSSTANGISVHYSSYRPNIDKSGINVNYNFKNYPYVKESNNYFYYKDGTATKSVSIYSSTAYDYTPSLPAQNSKKLSLMVADTMAAMGYKRMYTSTGSKDHNLYVTRNTNMTSILIENGFMSNPTELAKITNPNVVDETAKRIANAVISFYRGLPAELTSVSFDKASPEAANSTINLMASSNNKSDLYRFYLYDGKAWKMVQDYSTKSYYQWRPTLPGNYRFSIHVKNPYSTKEYDDYKGLDYTVYAPVKMESVTSDLTSPQNVDSAINLTAKATGGLELLYQFHVYDGVEWKALTNYSANNTVKWVPGNPGNYKFSVHVKDRYSSQKYDSYGTFEYTILGDPVQLNSVTTSAVSPQDVGTPVTFTADASGGVNRLYKFWIFDGQEWKVLSEYSTDNQATWTPTEAGDYRFSVHVKDSLSSNEYDDYAGFEFTAVQPPDITSLKADRPSPQAVGNTVTITAKGVGVQEALYRFYQYDGKEWTVLKDYGPENTIQWSPRGEGNYRISVHMKDSHSTKDYDTYKWFDYNFYVAPVKVSSLQASLPSPQPSGKTITLTANASGGTEKLYKFHAYDGKTWKVLRDYQASNQYAWTPIPGNYKLVVHVKDKNSTKAYDAYTSADYQVSDSPVQMEALNTSYASPQTAGTPVRITAQAIGGTDRRYAFHVYDGSAWTELQSYSSDNEYTWIPSKPGSYKFSVHVKDAKSTKRYDDYGTFEYQVVEDVKMVSVETDKASPQAANTTINVTATGKGGTERLYAFHVYDGKEWKLVQGYSANNQYSWKPTAAGNYKFSIHVKDKNSTRTYDDYGAFEYSIE
ncbi:triple tyrosine motif-containing protein [Mesobacillus jeotgali]|uniref:Triple tyrosine motif-containing protein n=1 Tax=Mesobacillus jeotgali TaxID=129985 RepID=A0ABY9VFF2_9BACI|nr:triple tyrosine motif-containing protein [Mesobacillus jeotgali]WNF22633.1 triple tyrosine motif-containing protein [Mesobacillus jeotgali]